MKYHHDEKMLGYAIRLTSRAEYTNSQVMKKLIAKGAATDSAEAICADLRESGSIDDARYCELFVSTHPDLGFARVRMELIRRGVDRALVDKCLVPDIEAETARAVALALEWCRFCDGRKIAGRLSRRGFSAVSVREALRRACGTSI